jgi:hypothetical protein
MNFIVIDKFNPHASLMFESKREIIEQEFIRKIIDYMLGKQEYTFLDYPDLAEKLYEHIVEDPTNPDVQGYVTDTGIDAIIAPIQHGDINIIYNVIKCINAEKNLLTKNLGKNFKYKHYLEQEEKRSFQYENKIKLGAIEHDMNKDFIREVKNIERQVFRETFNIPIFEAYTHVPGYRYNCSVSHLIGQDPAEGLGYVRSALVTWVLSNFPDNKIIRENLKLDLLRS